MLTVKVSLWALHTGPRGPLMWRLSSSAQPFPWFRHGADHSPSTPSTYECPCVHELQVDHGASPVSHFLQSEVTAHVRRARCGVF